jgi:transcriptional regulator with XRE-family HTH domain
MPTPDQLRKTWGTRCRHRRAALQLSLATVANRARVHESTISRLENGLTSTTLAVQCAVAEALLVSHADLFGPVNTTDAA